MVFSERLVVVYKFEDILSRCFIETNRLKHHEETPDIFVQQHVETNHANYWKEIQEKNWKRLSSNKLHHGSTASVSKHVLEKRKRVSSSRYIYIYIKGSFDVYIYIIYIKKNPFELSRNQKNTFYLALPYLSTILFGVSEQKTRGQDLDQALEAQILGVA